LQLCLLLRNRQNDNQTTLPLQYNHLIQGMIYNNIDDELADFLHNRGFTYNERTFKMFNFSNLFGKFSIDKKNKSITFFSDMKLYFSSPMDEFCQSFGNSILKKGEIVLGKNKLQVKEIQFIPTNTKSTSILVQTLSPIVAYSTFIKPDGGKYTCYFTPKEPMFQELVKENLRKKWQAFYNRPAPERFEIFPVGNHKQNVVIYKNTVIKGSSGLFRLRGDSELLSFALSAGLGSKGSQGFSCIQIINEGR